MEGKRKALPFSVRRTVSPCLVPDLLNSGAFPWYNTKTDNDRYSVPRTPGNGSFRFFLFSVRNDERDRRGA